jgi:glycerate 2-kinase
VRVVVAPEAMGPGLDAGRAAAAIRAGFAGVAPGTAFTDAVDEGVDLVVTGLAVLDWRALRDSPLVALAAAAAARGAPCVVLAGQVLAGRRELGAIGVDGTHETGPDPSAAALREAAALVAGRWVR